VPPLSAARLESLDLPPLSSLLAAGRDAGLIRLFACSASVRTLGLDMALVQLRVDAVLGWQSFARLTAVAGRVVTL
jgi:predicted peroxiredoxin